MSGWPGLRRNRLRLIPMTIAALGPRSQRARVGLAISGVLFFIALAIVSGCSGTNSSVSADGPSMDAASRDGEDAASCTATSESDLPGARMEIDTSVCVFTLAQARAGISIGYEVVIDESIPDVTPRAQDAGNCDQPDGSGLIPF